MARTLRRLITAAPDLVLHPRRAAALLFRRLLPIGILLKDQESYIAIGSWTFGKLPRRSLQGVFPGIWALDINVVRAFDRDLGTSTSVLETVTLGAITRHVQPRNILEIGTFDGNTALNFAANSPPDARIVTVDLPPDWRGELELDVPAPLLNVTDRRTVGSQVLKTEYAAKIRQVYGDSAKIDWSALGGPFDLIFIDGCHAYSYVKADTDNALRQIRPGGLIIWHDYGMLDDVSRAVDERANELSIVPIAGTRLAVGFAP